MTKQTIAITPEQKQLIVGYKSEAFEFLGEAEAAMTSFKEIVQAAHETTKLPKGIISKYFKTSFADKIKQLTEDAEVISFLNEQ